MFQNGSHYEPRCIIWVVVGNLPGPKAEDAREELKAKLYIVKKRLIYCLFRLFQRGS